MDQPQIREVDPQAAHQALADGALLIDVRERREWIEARIPGAVHKPMSQLNNWWQDLPTDRTVILQCRTGDRSGRITAALTLQAGLSNVANLTGGLVAWSQAGLDIEF